MAAGRQLQGHLVQPPGFTGEETEAQVGQVTAPGSPSRSAAEARPPAGTALSVVTGGGGGGRRDPHVPICPPSAAVCCCAMCTQHKGTQLNVKGGAHHAVLPELPPSPVLTLAHPCHFMIHLAFCRSQATYSVSKDDKGFCTPFLCSLLGVQAAYPVLSGGPLIPLCLPSATSSHLPAKRGRAEDTTRGLGLPRDSKHERPHSYFRVQGKWPCVQQDKFIHHLGEDTGKLRCDPKREE